MRVAFYILSLTVLISGFFTGGTAQAFKTKEELAVVVDSIPEPAAVAVVQLCIEQCSDTTRTKIKEMIQNLKPDEKGARHLDARAVLKQLIAGAGTEVAYKGAKTSLEFTTYDDVSNAVMRGIQDYEDEEAGLKQKVTNGIDLSGDSCVLSIGKIQTSSNMSYGIRACSFTYRIRKRDGTEEEIPFETQASNAQDAMGVPFDFSMVTTGISKGTVYLYDRFAVNARCKKMQRELRKQMCTGGRMYDFKPTTKSGKTRSTNSPKGK